MKTILLLVCLLVSFSSEASINFYKTYGKAVKESQKTDQLLFVDFTASWCGPCKRLESEVFSNDVVSDYYNAKFINVQLDEKYNGKLKREWNVQAYPTLLFFDSNKETVYRTTGGMSAKMFLELGKIIVELHNYRDNSYNEEALLSFLKVSSNQLADRHFKSLIKSAFYYLPAYQSLMIDHYGSLLEADYRMETELKNGNMMLRKSKIIRDKFAVNYFIKHALTDPKYIHVVNEKLKGLGFEELDEVSAYLCTLPYYLLSNRQDEEVFVKEKLVFGKSFILNYPSCKDYGYKLLIFSFLLENVHSIKFYEDIIETFNKIHKDEWNVLMHDFYSVALFKLDQKEMAIQHVTKANELAVAEKLKYRPTLSVLKIDKDK